MHYVTVHLLFCWAHEKRSVSGLGGQAEDGIRRMPGAIQTSWDRCV
jgi:hypothetical protein